MLYKYRNLKNYKFFIDIILNERLYVSSYSDLNDPMEGYYKYNTGELSDQVMKEIKDKKQKLGICSLSSSSDIELMWSHYCDGHRGIVIGVEIDKKKYEIEHIKYNGLSYISEHKTMKIDYKKVAKFILTNKHDIWKYEKEVRVFSESRNFINVKVKEIILGQKMDTRTRSFIKKLVKKINPEIEIKVSNIYNI